MTALFFSYLRYQKRCSAHTLEAYSQDLLQFEAHLRDASGKETAEALRPDIRRWIMHLSEQGLTATSINRKISSLRTYYTFLLRENHISGHPMVGIRSLRKASRLPEYVRENQMKKLFEDSNFSSDFSGLRDRLVLELLYGTGMRRSELLGLTISSLALGEGRVRVMGKRSKERWIPLHQNLVPLLNQYLSALETHLPEKPSPVLIRTDSGDPAYPGFIYRIVRKYLSMVTTAKKRSPHVLRHSFATHLLNAGAEISAIRELLGHASLAATQVYAHNTVEKLRQAYSQAHPRAKSRKGDSF
jgi:integrase/recombinase XerC